MNATVTLPVEVLSSLASRSVHLYEVSLLVPGEPRLIGSGRMTVKDTLKALGAFDGICEAAHAMHLVMTPTAWQYLVVEAYKAHNVRRPSATAFNRDRKAAIAAVVADIVAEVSK
jgi:hypothetical protein